MAPAGGLNDIDARIAALVNDFEHTSHRGMSARRATIARICGEVAGAAFAAAGAGSRCPSCAWRAPVLRFFLRFPTFFPA